MVRVQMVALAAIVLLLAYGTAGRQTLINDSTHAVQSVYVSNVGSTHWSADQLAGRPLPRGDSVGLVDIGCRSDYLVKVVDEAGHSYILRMTRTCDEDVEWRITEEELLAASQPVQLTQDATGSNPGSGSR